MWYITHHSAFGCRWPRRGEQTSLKWRRAVYRELSFEWHRLHSYSFVGALNEFDADIVAVLRWTVLYVCGWSISRAACVNLLWRRLV
jgi:hypothetical protein